MEKIEQNLKIDKPITNDTGIVQTKNENRYKKKRINNFDKSYIFMMKIKKSNLSRNYSINRTTTSNKSSS